MQTNDPVATAAHITVLRWTARVLAAIEILVGAFVLAGIFVPQGHAPLPFVSPGAPFGTYAQSTQMGIFTMVAGFALALVGGVLAFRWERWAARVFIASGAVEAFLLAMWLPDRTAPPGSHLTGFLVGVLPPLVVATLLLVVSRDSLSTRRR